MASLHTEGDEYHSKKLEKCCRVCAKVRSGKSYFHSCSGSHDMLLKAFGIDVSKDDEHVHPPSCCHTCHVTAQRLSAGGTAESGVHVYQWLAHMDVDCEVCNKFMAQSKGGRQKKTKKCGRPNSESSKGIANSVLKNAPKSWRGSQPLHVARFLPPSTSLSLPDLLCVVCHCIVDRPVETPCRKMVCAHCISGLVLEADVSAMQCPCCPESHNITSSCFPPASDVVLKVMGALLVHCDNPLCSSVVELKRLKEHVDSGCQKHAATFSPSKLTVEQILSRPLQSPPTATEQKAAASVVKRMCATSPSEQSSSSKVVKLTTDGTVRDLHECRHDTFKYMYCTLYI